MTGDQTPETKTSDSSSATLAAIAGLVVGTVAFSFTQVIIANPAGVSPSGTTQFYPYIVICLAAV